MTVPNITKDDVRSAIKRIRVEGVPPIRRERGYTLLYNGERYPPKYVVSLAVQNARGRALDPEVFGGGAETNAVLRQLGFSVVPLSEPSQNALGQALIGRVIVRGRPKDSANREAMLLDVLRNKWNGQRLKFLITPGGFVRTSFPWRWSGGLGWNSARTGLDALRAHVELALRRVVTDHVRKAAERKVDVLTIGIDLGAHPNKHAEFVAVYDFAKRSMLLTGKSYPTIGQEAKLVQVVDLNSHLMHLAGERVLVLGCHDPNMFSPRSRATVKNPHRRKRGAEMRKLARRFQPTVVLQHPHSTDSPNIWRTAWAGLVHELPGVKAWASGIGYYCPRGKLRAPLAAVQKATQDRAGSIDYILTASDY
jgi:hypothetical protein